MFMSHTSVVKRRYLIEVVMPVFEMKTWHINLSTRMDSRLGKDLSLPEVFEIKSMHGLEWNLMLMKEVKKYLMHTETMLRQSRWKD